MTHSASKMTPQMTVNRLSSRRKFAERPRSRSHAASRSASPPLVSHRRSAGVSSGRRNATEPSMVTPMTLLTSESFAIMARGSPVRKLTTIPAAFTSSIRAASGFSSRRAPSP
jgi:hypothetical protein